MTVGRLPNITGAGAREVEMWRVGCCDVAATRRERLGVVGGRAEARTRWAGLIVADGFRAAAAREKGERVDEVTLLWPNNWGNCCADGKVVVSWR